MVFCTYCQAIPAKLFEPSYLSEDGFEVSHQPSFHSLEASAAQGCELCSLLVDLVDAERSNFLSLMHDPQGQAFALCRGMEKQYLKIGPHMVVGAIDGRIEPLGWEKERARCDEIDQLKTIAHWLQTCQNDHDDCKRISANSYLPTRLVKVDTDDESQVQLVELKHKVVPDSRYLALSHCWGTNMPESALTKLTTLPNRLQCINISDLPLTFRDAINIARNLGVPYIWIDSMCIIQDCPSDWEREAAEMSSVYSSAFLTIAATGSADSSQGCRTDSAVLPKGPIVLDLPSKSTEDAAPAAKESIRIFPSDDYVSNFYRQPLQLRGWALQEREMSRRMLFYTKDTVR